VIGTCNYTNIVRGAFHACHLGYQIARDHEGRG
jgi:ribosomal-protein-alanine N-acetyltransferase